VEIEESPGVAEEMALLDQHDDEPTAGGGSAPAGAEPAGDADG